MRRQQDRDDPLPRGQRAVASGRVARKPGSHVGRAHAGPDGCASGTAAADVATTSITTSSSVGIGVVPHGEVGLIFASIGHTVLVAGAPVLGDAAFPAIIAMVMLTTLVTPPLLKAAFAKPSDQSTAAPAVVRRLPRPAGSRWNAAGADGVASGGCCRCPGCRRCGDGGAHGTAPQPRFVLGSRTASLLRRMPRPRFDSRQTREDDASGSLRRTSSFAVVPRMASVERQESRWRHVESLLYSLKLWGE